MKDIFVGSDVIASHPDFVGRRSNLGGDKIPPPPGLPRHCVPRNDITIKTE
ncbi:MAG: hypothetical protein AABZ77_07825 [Chloroflexota bacterium]